MVIFIAAFAGKFFFRETKYCAAKLPVSNSNMTRSRTRYFCPEPTLIVPSGSLEAEPPNEILSVGKAITWSGPAMAIGGLWASFLSSFAFMQEKNIRATEMDNEKRRNIFFVKEV